MQIEQAYKFLREQPNPFDLAYVSEGTDIVVHSSQKPEHLADGFLEKMMDTYDTDTIIALTKKGTGPVKRPDQRIIVTAKKALQSPSKMNTLPAPNTGNENMAVYNFMLQSKEDRIQDLLDKVRMLESSLRSSESDNKKLIEENMRIERENKLMEGKHELMLKGLQADHERALNDKTNTLGSQVMQGLGNPDLVNGVTTMAVGLVGAISNAIANAKPQQPTYQIGSAPEGMVPPAPHAVKPLQHMTRFMNGLSPDECNIFYYCTAHLAGNPSHRKEYFETYVKQSVAA